MSSRPDWSTGFQDRQGYYTDLVLKNTQSKKGKKEETLGVLEDGSVPKIQPLKENRMKFSNLNFTSGWLYKRNRKPPRICSLVFKRAYRAGPDKSATPPALYSKAQVGTFHPHPSLGSFPGHPVCAIT